MSSDNSSAAPRSRPRVVPDDWHSGTIPANASVDADAYVETSYSFHLFRSALPDALSVGKGSSVYLGVMFDVGPRGRVHVGRYTLLNGGRITCDAAVEIGDFALISWNVVIMDTYRVPADVAGRRRYLEALARGEEPDEAWCDVRPVRIGHATWIGFDACVLPGVTIGDGAVVGARSVVTQDVPPFTVVAGNPARVVRHLEIADPDVVARRRLEAAGREGRPPT